jgi:formamidopyrimidine-DNA glycosylase
VRFSLGDHELVFDDPRRFGTGELALGPDALEAFFSARLGVEPLEQDFTGDHLFALARTSRAPVKAFLLDQKRVAGVGNIYADEALFRARVHPLRPANRLTRAQCAAIRDAVVESLMAGLAAKGATIDDFRDPYGVSGTFQDQFLVHLREHEPCPNCSRPVRKLRVAGRGTYVCERCQPRPRAARRPR